MLKTRLEPKVTNRVGLYQSTATCNEKDEGASVSLKPLAPLCWHVYEVINIHFISIQQQKYMYSSAL